jgi:hypothetical protein
MVDIFISGDKGKQSSKVDPSFAKAQVNSAKGASRKGINLNNSGLRRARHETVADKLLIEQKNGRMKGLSVLPKKVHFETQEDKEKIILLLRQHWATQLNGAFIALAMLFLPIVLSFIPLIDFLPENFRFMVILIWYLLVIAFVYEQFISWFFHVFIITDERIIDIDFYNLLYKQVSEAKIDNIEDVTYTQGGVVKAMFDYGNVSMQTAAETKQFEIENVPQPNRVVQILNELKLEEEQEKIEGRVR